MMKKDKKKEVELEKTNDSLQPKLEKKDIKVEDKLKIVEEKLLRTMAEMENQRRRFEKEREEAYEYGGFNFARESLSLLDNIDRAITSFKNDEKLKDYENLNKIIDGIEIVKKDLVSIFKKNGIEAIKCINEKFDPNFHEAMFEIEDNSKNPGINVQEVQKGYVMKDRLLRPSMVGVTKKIAKKDKEKEDVDNKNEKKIEKS